VVIQAAGRIQPAWRAALEATGANINEINPEYA
jgi:hypothetical protein